MHDASDHYKKAKGYTFAFFVIRKPLEKGIVLAGISAGAICWFDWYDNMDDIEKLDDLALVRGLGFVKDFGVPHYDWLNEKEREKNQFIAKRKEY